MSTRFDGYYKHSRPLQTTPLPAGWRVVYAWVNSDDEMTFKELPIVALVFTETWRCRRLQCADEGGGRCPEREGHGTHVRNWLPLRRTTADVTCGAFETGFDEEEGVCVAHLAPGERLDVAAYETARQEVLDMQQYRARRVQP